MIAANLGPTQNLVDLPAHLLPAQASPPKNSDTLNTLKPIISSDSVVLHPPSSQQPNLTEESNPHNINLCPTTQTPSQKRKTSNDELLIFTKKVKQACESSKQTHSLKVQGVPLKARARNSQRYQSSSATYHGNDSNSLSDQTVEEAVLIMPPLSP